MCVCVCVYVCVCARVRACVRACVCVCVANILVSLLICTLANHISDSDSETILYLNVWRSENDYPSFFEMIGFIKCEFPSLSVKRGLMIFKNVVLAFYSAGLSQYDANINRGSTTDRNWWKSLECSKYSCGNITPKECLLDGPQYIYLLHNERDTECKYVRDNV